MICRVRIYKNYSQRVPCNLYDVDEIASFIIDLIKNKNKFLTGQNILIDGGLTAWKTMDELDFIAEIGINHEGSLSLAKELICAAKESGATIAKFQTYKTQKS